MEALHSNGVSSLACEHPHWPLVERVAASPFFAKAPKLKAFLLYICENALLGKTENLTAQLIGIRVFGRPSTYVPNEDNIVRVEARELRKRLAAYFEAEGDREPVVIEIPKGGYIPVFSARKTPILVSLTAAAGSDAPRHWSQASIAGLTLLVVILSVLLIWQAVRSSHNDQQQAYFAALPGTHQTATGFSIYRELLGSLGLNPQREAVIVLSNPRLMNFTLSDSPLPSLPSRTPVPADFAQTLRGSLLLEEARPHAFIALNIARDGYTGMGEAVAAFHLGRLMNLLGRRVRLTEGRFLTWASVDRQDLILLGGPRSNNWRYESDASYEFSIRDNSVVNAHAWPGEQALYTRGPDTDYAIIQKATTSYHFATLMMAGVSSAGTAAAGQFFADPAKMAAVYRQIRVNMRGNRFPAEWGVILKVAMHDSIPIDSTVVAIHPGALPAEKTFRK